jgi:hypothetical protein
MASDGIYVGAPTVNIASGASLSGSISCPGTLAGIQMPAAWTTASLTFQVSLDGSTFTNVYDKNGNEYTVLSTSSVASQYVIIPPADTVGWKYIKVRSGSSGSPVTQTRTNGTNLTLSFSYL